MKFLCTLLFTSMNILMLSQLSQASDINQKHSDLIVKNELSTEINLRLLTENYPPLNYVDKGGVLVGPSIDIVAEIQRLLKIENKIEVLPFKRAYMTILGTENSVMFSLAKTPDRANLFKWVGPLAIKKYSFFARKSSKIKINSFDDISRYRIGVQIGAFTENILRSKNLEKVSAVSLANQNLKKLMQRRIDLWFVSYSAMLLEVKEKNIDLDRIEEVFAVKNITLAIAFNNLTSDNVVLAWQRTLNKLYENGFVKAVFEKHGQMTLYTELGCCPLMSRK